MPTGFHRQQSQQRHRFPSDWLRSCGLTCIMGAYPLLLLVAHSSGSTIGPHVAVSAMASDACVHGLIGEPAGDPGELHRCRRQDMLHMGPGATHRARAASATGTDGIRQCRLNTGSSGIFARKGGCGLPLLGHRRLKAMHGVPLLMLLVEEEGL
jgi:hypothetical protein